MKRLNNSELTNVSGGVIIKLVPLPGSCENAKKLKLNTEVDVLQNLNTLAFMIFFNRTRYISYPDTFDLDYMSVFRNGQMFNNLADAESHARDHGWSTEQKVLEKFWDVEC